MAARYQIWLKDQSGTRVAIITDWLTLEYTLRVNGFHSHKLAIDGDLAKVDLFELDGQLEIWREDLDAGSSGFTYVFPVPLTQAFPPIPLYLDYEGFHRTTVRRNDRENRAVFESRGVGYDHLLARRVVLYYAASAQADKSGVGETVMKEYVDENAGPSATAPNRLFAGVTTGLTIEADGAAGGTWEGERSFRNLLEVVQGIADATDVDFGVVGTGAATYEFQAKAQPWGDDRSLVGLDPATGLNGAGNPPVVFSLEYGNMLVPEYADNRVNEINAALVLGQGSESDRAVVERTSGAESDSPWNRLEGVQRANQEADTAGLESVGDTMLEKLQARETFGFEAVQTPSTLYGREYFLGDLVTGRYRDIERTKQIIAVTVAVAEGREDIAIELGDVT